MGTHPDHHADDADRSVSRLLRDGQREPLARAKETLKDRLLQKMTKDVLEELQDTDRVAAEALREITAAEEPLGRVKEAVKERLLKQARDEVTLEAEEDTDRLVDAALEASVAGEDGLKQVREELKERLLQRLLQQVVEEIGRGAGEEVDRLADQVLEESVSGGSALDGVREAFKERLLEKLLQQAIEEIGEEVEVGPEEAADSSSEAAEGSEAVEDALHPLEEDAEFALQLLSGASETEADEEESPLIDVSFWEEEGWEEEAWEEDSDVVQEIQDPEEAVSAGEEHATEEEESGEENEEGGFFLSSEPSEPGAVSGDASSAEEEAVELGGAVGEEAVQVSGDGAWYGHAAADLVTEAEAETSPEESRSSYVTPSLTAVSTPQETVYYLYGIASGGDEIAAEALPEAGIDPAFPVELVSEGSIQAVVSRVRSDAFGAEALTEQMHDAAWVERHGRIHEDLVRQISENGALLPVPFGTIYPDREKVREMILEVAFLEEVERLQGKYQWNLKVFRDREALHQRVVQDSETVKGLMADIKSKPKGGAKSIKEKMVATIQEEMALLTENCTKDVHERLLVSSEDAELGSPGKQGSGKEELILDATYLVPESGEKLFREEIEDLSQTYSGQGFDIKVVGPAPPTLFSRVQAAHSS